MEITVVRYQLHTCTPCLNTNSKRSLQGPFHRMLQSRQESLQNEKWNVFTVMRVWIARKPFKVVAGSSFLHRHRCYTRYQKTAPEIRNNFKRIIVIKQKCTYQHEISKFTFRKKIGMVALLPFR